LSLPNEVDVYLDDPRGPIRVGNLRPSYAGGRNLASASFQYDREFLGSPSAYAISPDLPLVASRTFTEENKSIFGTFSDASPDEWGQKIIEASHAVRLKEDPTLPRRIGAFDYLLGVSDYTRMGALRMKAASGTEWLSSDAAVADIHDLERVLAVTTRYEEHRASDEDVAYLSDIATSPGGARPKANVVTASNKLAIAKLPHSKDGNIDVEAWEAVALTLARQANIRTPRFAAQRVSNHRAVLISERFDRGEKNERYGYMSAATALGIGSNDDRRITYEEFADTIVEISAQPKQDLHEMYRRVAFTVLVNNVDDHWRNHGFLRERGGWRLSPLFDVNPSPRHGVIASRAISDQDDPAHRDISNLLLTASAYRLTADEGAQIIGEVADAVLEWPTIARRLAIPNDQISTMTRAFDEPHLHRARELTRRRSHAESAATSESQVWVKPHVRHGAAVDGHWRAARKPRLD
jgi:serine/threonine-protein kinase HipA